MDHKIETADQLSTQDEFSIQAISSIWVYFPAQLCALKTSRSIITDEAERIELNFLAVTSLTCFIESVVNDIVLELVHQLKKLSPDTRYQRIISDLEGRVHSCTFQKYNDILQELTRTKMNDYTTEDTWECIAHLFTFRNKIVHSKHFSYAVTSKLDR